MTSAVVEQRTCKDRVREHYLSRVSDLRELFKRRESEDEAERESACEDFASYGLSFDYVAPDTFKGQKRGYWRYQLSWGGPSDEFRFYCDERRQPVRVEYWFLDWFDGAHRTLRAGRDFALLMEVWEEFDGLGMVESTYQAAFE